MAKFVPSANLELTLEPGAVKEAAKLSGAKSGEVFMVPPDQIIVLDGFNVRITGTPAWEEKITALEESIMSEGFYRDKPLGVTPVKLEGGGSAFAIIDGHRRYEAALRAIKNGAPITHLPVIATTAGKNEIDHTIAMTKTGEPLAPMELAIAVGRLSKYGMEDSEIAKRVGITKTYVADLLAILSLPAKMRNMIIAGSVSAGTALAEFRADGGKSVERVEKAVETVKAKGKTKATPKDIEKAAPKPDGAKRGRKPNPLRTEFAFEAQAGQEFSVADLKPYARLGGGDWWAESETEGMLVVLQDVKISGVCTLKEKPIGSVVGTIAGTEDL